MSTYEQEVMEQHSPANSRGHVWIMDDDYDPPIVDVWKHEGGHYCNGPKCVACGYSFCHHCHERPQKDCPK